MRNSCRRGGRRKAISAHLLNGVSLAGLLCASAAWSGGAHAADPPVYNVSRGKWGRDSTGFHPVPVTPGQDAQDVDVSINEPILIKAADTPKDATLVGAGVEIGSIGGSGGSWGSMFLAPEAYISGEPGGKGGNVTVTQAASVSTGTGAPAYEKRPLVNIFSIGGDGGVALLRVGQGGNAGTVSYTLSGSVTNYLGWNTPVVLVRSLGGSDRAARPTLTRGAVPGREETDAGGKGGDVDVELTSTSTILSKSPKSPALVVESRGGKGGDKVGTGYGTQATYGGAAGRVKFIQNGAISATGLQSIGVILQSVGGAGGDNNATQGGEPGGVGGEGSTVDAKLTSNGSIRTKGDYALGLVAQSVGGRGGNGAEGFFVGGKGGAAGDGGTVTVTNGGSILTEGRGAIGILAQSTGGGTGGAVQIAEITKSGGGGAGGSGGFLFFGGGGEGGNGGTGGPVTVVNTGTITTTSQDAFGILAQSVGGSGGNGGDGTSYGFVLGGSKGGTGGGGGDGGSVLVGVIPPDPLENTPPAASTTNFIRTYGRNATGILAQSIGGGGGAGGTANSNAVGLIGAISVAIGGDGGHGGHGGQAQIYNTTIIATYGASANGATVRSVGGGGGEGGDASAYALSAAPPDTPALSFSYTVGGDGGNGGSGGMARAVNFAPIITAGEKSYGIFAQSIGGGGGSGSSATTVAESIGFFTNVEVSVALGGTGGGGGNGGEANIVNVSTVKTAGSFANALFASSIGGGGGDGGLASSTMAGTITGYMSTGSLGALSAGTTLSISAALGGSGGKGGNGGLVSIDNHGSVSTSGRQSAGAFAQSVGGGGGNAGGFLSEGAKEFSLNLGGTLKKEETDGGGGDGGSVTITNFKNATISTTGVASAGMFVQSVGGGGGNGGSWAGSDQPTSLFSVEGVKAIYKLATTGYSLMSSKGESTTTDPQTKRELHQQKWNQASGIWSRITSGKDIAKDYVDVVQKNIRERLKPAIGDLNKQIDKYKANEKFPNINLSMSLGGDAGKGGSGGVATAKNHGYIVTDGASAYGMFAQSVGGGGGSGGGAIAAGKDIFTLKMAVGGTGGQGGEGGTVLARNSGSISTRGTAAMGIFAQSIGGGGGVGGAASNPNVLSGFAAVSLGGASGKASDASKVEVENSGSISTKGKEAHALVAQSIGGGGGHYFVKRESLINPLEIMNLINQGSTSKSPKINAEDAEILVGSLLEWLGLETQQISADKAKVRDSLTQQLPSFSAVAAIGGRAKTTGNGGRVQITNSGNITTEGLGAFGIFAQSIGGGGGFGSDASALSLTDSAWTLGGTDRTSGKGGDIVLTFDGRSRVATAGDGGTGVFLQSIGGGGGYGGVGRGTFTIADATRHRVGIPVFTIYSGTTGDGGAIKVLMAGDASPMNITTSGTRAHGLHAQSLGGGGGTAFKVDGGNPAFSSNAKSRRPEMNGTGGVIDVTTNGHILTKGADSYGIFLQSGVQKLDGTLDPARAGERIALTHTGTIEGGTGVGAAIRIDGGKNNEIHISENSTVKAASGIAVYGSYATDSIFNKGTLIGDIDLIAGGTSEKNVFENQTKGTYETRAGNKGILKLGNGGTFTNRGLLEIGGNKTIGVLNIDPDVSVTLGGRMRVDVNSLLPPWEGRNDMIAANTEIKFDNLKVEPNVIGGLFPGDTFNLFLRSPEFKGTDVTVVQNPYSPISWNVTGAPAIQAKADFYRSAQAAAIGTQPLTPTEEALINKWQNDWNRGSHDNAELFGKLANVVSAQDYRTTIDSTSPEGQGRVAAGQAMNASLAMAHTMSCPVFVDEGTQIDETQCVWSRITGSRTQISDSAQSDGYKQNAMSYRIGAQWEVQPDWFLGATAAYNNTWGNATDGYSSTTGTGGDASLALKHQMGPWLLAGALHVGYSNNEIHSTLDVGDAVWSDTNSSKVWTGAARARAAYEFAFPNWYIRPYVDMDVIYTSMSGYTIDGDVFNLRVGEMSGWTFAFHPAIEIGARIDFGPTGWLRPYLTAGITYLAGNALSAQVELYDNQADGTAFTTTEYMPDLLYDIGAGLQFFAHDTYELRGEYKAQIGAEYLNQEGSIRFSSRF